jgi:hypothetical protein
MSTNALPLFDAFPSAPRRPAPRPRFAGSDYSPAHDDARLSGQAERIFNLMKDSRWRTLGEIEEATGDPQASVSAQLRHLRKKRFGSHDVQKRPRGARENGLWEYAICGVK